MQSVLALDGEGITRKDGSHDYTLLLAYDCDPHYQRSRYIENVYGRLSTSYILRFLVHQRCKNRIVCGFYLNYDVAKWVEDLSDQDKTALWKSGWVVWKDGSYNGKQTCYYLRYIPGKLFFVGEWTPDLDLQRVNEHNWPLRHLLIYDVSGFFQCSFVQALREWQKSIGITARELVWIRRQKRGRSTFTTEEAETTRIYCERECYWLSKLVVALAVTFQQEGVKVHGWHGSGAVGSFYLAKERVGELLSDLGDLSGERAARLQDAILRSYFGGRNEVCQMGRLRHVLDYDMHSAYPAACLMIPDLVHGSWDERSEYDPDATYALWHVSWDLRDQRLSLGPFPVRRKHGVYYPDAGSGWYHAVEVQAALRYFQPRGRASGGQESGRRERGGIGAFRIDRGWVYTPRSAVHPFDFVRELAAKRLSYKRAGDPRQVPYKFALNSLYGKLAQHATQPGQRPPFQSYCAAGLVTAGTRSRLLHFLFQFGDPAYSGASGPESDVVMIATDGLFCTRERLLGLGHDLGDFALTGRMEDGYVIQPGVWYGADRTRRTRGFFAHSLDYGTIATEWRRGGVYGHLPFTETRFIGLGACTGRGSYADYGRWINVERQLCFYPERKYPGVREGETLRLLPLDMGGIESEPFVPTKPQDAQYAEDGLQRLVMLLLQDNPEGV